MLSLPHTRAEARRCALAPERGTSASASRSSRRSVVETRPQRGLKGVLQQGDAGDVRPALAREDALNGRVGDPGDPGDRPCGPSCHCPSQVPGNRCGNLAIDRVELSVRPLAFYDVVERTALLRTAGHRRGPVPGVAGGATMHHRPRRRSTEEGTRTETTKGPAPNWAHRPTVTDERPNSRSSVDNRREIPCPRTL